MRVAVVTNIPSPYQVELFDALSASGIDLTVVYIRRTEAGRQWAGRQHAHEFTFADEHRDIAAARVASADLSVFSWYSDGFTRQWMRERAASGRPWCFWGERPGARRTGLAGRWYRRWRLAPLHEQQAPIWGIGSWAVAGYQREFGHDRLFRNVPYFSDLTRFAAASPKVESPDRLRVLYSGSLTKRKGVDLLATACAGLADAGHNFECQFVGFGPLEALLRERLQDAGDRAVLRGFMDWDELPRAYADADLLVAPSRYDGWGLIVAEGLAAGLPVIATDAMGAAHDLIVEGQNGWRIEAGSGNALMSAMEQAITMSTEQRVAMRERALASVANHQLEDGVAAFTEAAQASFDAMCTRTDSRQSRTR